MNRAVALAPLSTADADDLLHGFRAAGHLLADTDKNAVREVLLRVAELDINPLLVSDQGCVVVDARVRVAPVQHTDPFLRRLRTS